ncbi:MAG: PcfJ domain-containing protein [Hyphomicrobiaceae bacterium]
MRQLNSSLLPKFESKAARRRRRLNLFQPPFRKYVAGLTSTSPAIEDLADSFPALLFAMATGYGTASGREAAFRAVVDGQALKEAATLLGLPMWTRRIPAGALAESFPLLPLDEAFALEVVNRIPQGVADCQTWLDRFLTGLRLVGRDMGVWIAREPRLMPPAISDEMFQWLLAWAWVSITPTSPGHRMLRGSWALDVGLKRAVDELAVWRKRIDLIGALADANRDPWYADAQLGGYEIVQLKSVDDFIAESSVMENCLDQYAAHLAYGRVRIFSIRREGRAIADIELTIRADKPSEACLSQVRGPRNRRAPPGVWQVVTAWLEAQPRRPLSAVSTPAGLAREHLDHFWRPYIITIDAAGLTLRLPSAVVARDRLRGEVRTQPPVAAPRAIEPPPTLVQRMVRVAGRGG